MFPRKIGQLLFIPVVASSLLPRAVAQEEAIEEVVVTAQKREQGINDVGMTITAITGESLKELGVLSAEDIAAVTPGLSVGSAGATGVPVYTIRGVGGFQDITTSSSSTVGLYFDEVAIPYTVMSRGALFDVERVEVLKGPQGDLYGRNTTAGQINYVSRKPTDEFGAGVTASYGSFQTFDLEGHVTGSLSERVQGRIAFRTVQSGEGWQKSLTRPGDTLGEKDVKAIRALLNFEISDNASALLRVHYVDDKSDNQAQTAYDGRLIGIGEFGAPYRPLNQYRLPTGTNFGQPVPWYSTGDNRRADWNNSWTSPITGEVASLRPVRDNQLSGISAKIEWNIGETLLTSITAYDDFQRSETNDVDGTPHSVQENINDTNLTVFSQELRLSRDSERLFWVAGVYYSEDDVDEFYNFFMEDAIFGAGSAAWGLPAPFTRFPIRRLHTRYQQATESSAIFGRIEYKFADRFKLTLGARYTDEQRDWSGCTFDAGDGGYVGLWNGLFRATLAPGACSTLDDTAGSPTNIARVIGTPNINSAFHVFETEVSTGKWIGRVGLDYRVSDDILTYVTVSTGFKSGGFNGNNSNTTSQLRPYLPEEITAFEAGLKATLSDGRAQLNLAAFHYDYENKQESERAITPVGAIGGLGNVPKSKITGAEVDLTWRPITGLNVSLGATYLDSKIEEWLTPLSGTFSFATGTVTNLVLRDASGAQLPQAPELSANVAARYEWSITSGLLMDVGFDVDYTDDMPDPVRPQNSVEGYTLVNARIGLGSESGKWRAMLWGRNIGDRYYFPAAFGGTNGGYARSVGMPRTVGISLNLRL